MSLDGSQPQPTSGDDFKRLAENAAPRLQQKTKNLFSKFFSSKSSALDSEFSIDESRRQAIKLYERAASEYKIEQKYLESAECFLEVARIQRAMNSSFGASRAQLSAAESYELAGNFTMAIRIIRECIAEDDSNNRLDKSARNAIKLGELLSKTSETDEALKCFDRAFKVFASLSNHSMDANKALERKAQLLIEMENFLEAAKCYSDLYHRFSQNNVLKFSASAMLLKAFLAKLCIDDVDAKIYFEMQSTDRDINKTLEVSSIKKIIESIQKKDKALFDSAIQNFNNSASDSALLGMLWTIGEKYFTKNSSKAHPEANVNNLQPKIANDDVEEGLPDFR